MTEKNVPEPVDLTNITIRRIDNPRQELLTIEAIDQLGLVDLLARGYDMQEPDRENSAAKKEFVAIEYDQADVVFLAQNREGKVVGSLAYAYMQPDSHAWVPFFRALEQEFHIQAALLRDQTLIHSHGFTVLPEYQQKGLGKKIIDEAFSNLQPAMILGETKTPAVVAARVKQMEGKPYRVFFGKHEVTSGDEVRESSDHTHLLRAYDATMAALYGNYLVSKDTFRRDATFVVTTDLLQPAVPVVQGRLAPGFQKLTEQQRGLGSLASVVSPIITIRSALLRR